MLRHITLLYLSFCVSLSCSLAVLACGETPTYLSFIENKGQWASNIHYQAELNSARLYIEPTRLTYLLNSPDDMNAIHEAHHHQITLTDMVVHYHAFRVNFVGANTGVVPIATCQETRYNNYYIGNNPAKWASRVGIFNETNYTNLFAGIDMRLYGDGGAMKYDFTVAPNANVSDIRMQYEGADNIYLQNDKLYVATSVNTMIDAKPFAYQYIDGQMVQVGCRFVLNGTEVGFETTEDYDHNRELIIDPEIVFATYTGSTTDNWGFTATYDNEGHLYAGGEIFSGAGYPTTVGAFQINFAGGEEGGYAPSDIGITKFSPDGSTLIYSTYLGGSGNEIPESLIVDANNNLILLGTTASNDFPVSSNAFDNSFNGGEFITVDNIIFGSGTDLIVTKFNADGDNLIASTYLGGIANDGFNTAVGLKYNYADEGRGEVQLDEFGNIYVVSTTQSPDFPTTDGTFQPEWVNGQDGVLCKFDPNLSTIIWGTYLGGSEDDAAYSVKIASDGYLYACGGTTSTDFPTTAGTLHPNYNGGQADGWIARISPDGSELVASSFVGTGNYDQVYFVDLDADNNVYITGQTNGGTYPVFPASVYNNANSGNFIHKMNSNLNSTVFSTVIGNGNGFANLSPSAFLVDRCNKIFLSGWGGNVNGGAIGSTTTGLATSAGAFQTTTDGSDFYFLVLEPNATSLHYATFFGAFGGTGEHVDGGTSRFDKEGRIYQAVCAGCGGSDLFPTTPGAWSQTNNASNCNLGAIKFDFQTAPTVADFVQPQPGCAPYAIDFTNFSINADSYIWNFGDDSPTTTVENPSHTYTAAGTYEISLISTKPGTCNGADTLTKTITVGAVQQINITSVGVCVDGNSLQLVASPSGGVWLGTNVSPTGVFTPAGLAAGNYPYTYTIDNGIPNCASVAESSVTVYGLPTISLVSPPTYLQDGSGNFEFSVVVNGSDDSYVLGGDFDGTANNGQTIALIHPNSGADNYLITAVGSTNGCETNLLIQPPPCDPSAGTMPTTQQTVCSNGTVSAQTVGEILEPDMVLGYALHTSPTATPGSILAANQSGSFVFADLNGAQYYTTYYISAVVGYPNANGFPILNDPCTRVNAGTPVVFLAPITFVVNEFCDWESTGNYTVTAFPKGGLPQYDGISSYQITGDANETLAFGESTTIIYTTDQTPNLYSFTATDGLGCSGSVSNNFPLCIKTPIELLSFTGKVVANGNELKWTTATEANNQYFEVERATPANPIYQVIGIINSKVTNSSTQTDYSFVDRTATAGTTYYRLRWVDMSGNTEKSNSIVLNRNKQTTAVSLSPIPATDVLYIGLTDIDTQTPVTLSVIDVLGRTVLTQTVISTVNNTCSLSIGNLSKGIYFLRVSIDGVDTMQKWLKD